jgi:hypothetical protein
LQAGASTVVPAGSLVAIAPNVAEFAGGLRRLSSWGARCVEVEVLFKSASDGTRPTGILYDVF